MSTKEQIIQKFHLYMDDSSELSSQEESDLFDRVLVKIYSERPWEWLKKAYTGTQSITVPYVALPDDFSFLTQNNNYTESSFEAERPAIFVGTSYTPYPVVSWSDRRQYRNQDGYAYIDISARRLYFTLQPIAANPIEYDYHFIPEALDSNESPVFPTAMALVGERAIFHGMCVDEFVIQQVDKAKSYAIENKGLYDAAITELAYNNANLIQQ